MSTRDRLKRLTGEAAPPAKEEDDRLGDLRRRIDAILSRRPEPPKAPRPTLTGGGQALEELLAGREERTPWGPFFSVEAVSGAETVHGCRPLRELADVSMERISLLAGAPALARFALQDGLFLDTETTGLSGGTGTMAFLVGAGWFDGRDFRTRQLFARDFGEERAVLSFLRDLAEDRKFLVTFNGKVFDLGVLSTRFILNRVSDPLVSLPHLDLLHPSRRIFRHRLESCRLSSLEATVLKFHREGDVPGWEIPQRYFDWLRRRDGRLVSDIFEHNRLDILSMAALVIHFSRLLEERGPGDGEHPAGDCLAAARLFHDRQRFPEARSVLEGIIAGNGEASGEAKRRLSLLHKRNAQWDEAVRLWQEMVDENPGNLFAVEELAKCLEHRSRDYGQARDLVERALARAPWEARPALRRRLERLTRKEGRKSPAE